MSSAAIARLQQAAAASFVAAATLSAGATDCGSDALGTARVLELAHEYAAYGRVQHAGLPLAPGEVVLTFDDGPRPESTPLVLKALEAECVRASFFMVGESMLAHPGLAKEVRAQGHSVGLHGFQHLFFSKQPEDQQLADLQRVEQGYAQVFGVRAPAYRFPFLDETPFLRGALAAGGYTVMSVDLGVEDWEPQTTQQMLDKLVQRLADSNGGIVLLHDTQDRTAAALPQMLRALKEHGYRVVHLEWK
ncbi:MAG TPA: polysaccharide deacetylase family protein [Albitalea sp.]|nr:polysaccharide deacetylase family protein [Albitalea sp.]